MIKRSIALVALLAILVAGVAIGATIYVAFEQPQTGVYNGPGVPIVKSYSITVGTNDSYYAMPMYVNYTGQYYINLTDVSINIGGQGYTSSGFIIMLMNLTNYANFKANLSLNYLTGGITTDLSYLGTGAHTYYFVFLNEVSNPSEFGGLITVTLV